MIDPTIACELTGAGRGAVAVIGVCGTAAIESACEFFQAANPRRRLIVGHIRYGTWVRRADQAGESVVVTLLDQRSLEIHCHGGRAAVASILADLQSVGVTVCNPAQWLDYCGTNTLIREAELLLTRTTTRRTAAFLYDQVCGAMQQQSDRWHRALQDPGTEIEQVKRQIQAVARLASFGLHLTTPWQVVLAGKPNAGKSSLLNALVGFQRAISHEQAGTTRDVVQADTVFHGWPFTLSDTAGLRDAADAVEAAGIQRAFQAIAAADLILHVIDITAKGPLTADPLEQEALSSGKPVLQVFNKCDLQTANHPPTEKALTVSASAGSGLETLIQRVIQTLIPRVPQPGDPIPITHRQVEILQAAAQCTDPSTLRALLQQLSVMVQPTE